MTLLHLALSLARRRIQDPSLDTSIHPFEKPSLFRSRALPPASTTPTERPRLRLLTRPPRRESLGGCRRAHGARIQIP